MLELARRIFRLFKPLLPAAWLRFASELRQEHPLVDRTEVVLYASTDILPAYSPRSDLVAPRLHRQPQKVTLIATLRNEAANLPGWLESLLQQARLPDEIILVDGGSTDGSLEILRRFAARSPVPFSLIEAAGVNIAGGRNLAVQHASHTLIACTDCGCILEPEWLTWLLLPFERDETIELSAGYYHVHGKTLPARLARELFGIDVAALDPQRFYPSGRSLAFRKAFFERVGGYPVWLSDAGEDTLFAYRAKGQPARWAFVPEAQVAWQTPDSLAGLLRKIFRYAVGDGEAATNTHLYRYKLAQVGQGGLNLIGLVLPSLLLAWAYTIFIAHGAWIPGLKVGLLFYAACLTGMLLGWFLRSLPQDLRAARRLGLAYFPYSLLLEVVGWLQALGFLRGARQRAHVHRRQVALLQEQLEALLARHAPRRGLIIYPPTHDWSFMFQRPHQVARAMAQAGYLYFYCTSNERTDAVYGFQEIEPGLILSHVPLEVFSILKKPVVYVGSPWHAATLAHFQDARLVYDHYDDLAVSGGRPVDHDFLLQHADVVLVTSRRLLEQVHAARRAFQRAAHPAPVILMPNGVDLAAVERSRPQPGSKPPPDWPAAPDKCTEGASSARPRRVIGYAGALASWVDYALLVQIAHGFPDDLLVLIGVDYDGSLNDTQPGRSLLALPNVHWLGMKPYAELFNYVWRFDVGIIPFQVNEITLATSPIKQFEYLACELPVVAAALPECRCDQSGQAYPGVWVADDTSQFIRILGKVLELSRDATFRQRLRHTAQANTWQARLEPLCEQLDAGSA